MNLTAGDIFQKNASYGREFHIHGGPDVKNLRELLHYLPRMSDEQFSHHVNREKNDFAKWLEDVNGPGSVCEVIRRAGTREDMMNALQARVNEYDADRADHPEEQETAERMDDDTFGEMKKDYADRNEEIQDKFDRIAQEMKEAMDDEMPEQLLEIKEELNERYDDLRTKISDLRRQGRDCLMASLLLRQFPAKLGIAEASREKSDFESARDVLVKVQDEVDEIAGTQEMDVKREVLEMAGLCDSVKKDEEA